jgi:hypothetical protein
LTDSFEDNKTKARAAGAVDALNSALRMHAGDADLTVAAKNVLAVL